MMADITDANRLRELAKQVAEIVAGEKNQKRINWYKTINSIKIVPPPVHFVPPPPPHRAIHDLFELDDCQTEDPFLRKYESQLLQILRRDEKLGDDQPTFGIIHSGFEYSITPWMEGMHYTHFTMLDQGDNSNKRYFEPCLTNMEDFDKLRFPKLRYNKKKTQENFDRLSEIFAGILPVVKGFPTSGHEALIPAYTVLRGLEQTYYDFIDNPEFVHKLMKFLQEGQKQLISQIQSENMLCLNNTGTRIGSCNPGYTDELPAPGFDPDLIRKQDLWGLSAAQELSEVSPEMLEEFVLPYEVELLDGYGLVCYGCCEPMENKIDVAERYIKNLRMISFNPFTNYSVASEKCRGKYVCAWKPSSAYMVNFNEEENRKYLLDNLKLMKGCCVTITLEDTYSYGNDLSRFKRWVEIAHEVINELY
jgi:hypothetical protein